MLNGWSKQEYVQIFGSESINLKNSVNIIERMEIVEYIYYGVVGTSNKKTTRSDANHDGYSNKMRGESASSKTYSCMIKITVKRKQSYVGHPRDISKRTCLIHGHGHSSN